MDFEQIAKKTPGFVGADLSSLTKEAAVVAINRIFTRLRASPATPSPHADLADNDTIIGTSGADPDGVVNGVADSGTGADEAAALSKGQSGMLDSAALPPTTALECVADRGDTGGVDDGKLGGLPVGSPNRALSVKQGQEEGASEEEGEVGGAKAVGGFLAGPLSPAQLAPLSVTMEDFLAAVKKVENWIDLPSLFSFFVVWILLMGSRSHPFFPPLQVR